MAKIYADLIRKGLKTIYDVPESLREAVIEILDGEGTDYNNTEQAEKAAAYDIIVGGDDG